MKTDPFPVNDIPPDVKTAPGGYDMDISQIMSELRERVRRCQEDGGDCRGDAMCEDCAMEVTGLSCEMLRIKVPPCYVPPEGRN